MAAGSWARRCPVLAFFLKRLAGAPLIRGVRLSGFRESQPPVRPITDGNDLPPTLSGHDERLCSTEKRIEKLRYMHRNPIKRCLAAKPEDWKWSSFRSYACGEEGVVKVNRQEWPLRITYSASRSHSFETRE